MRRTKNAEDRVRDLHSLLLQKTQVCSLDWIVVECTVVECSGVEWSGVEWSEVEWSVVYCSVLQ